MSRIPRLMERYIVFPWKYDDTFLFTHVLLHSGKKGHRLRLSKRLKKRLVRSALEADVQETQVPEGRVTSVQMHKYLTAHMRHANNTMKAMDNKTFIPLSRVLFFKLDGTHACICISLMNVPLPGVYVMQRMNINKYNVHGYLIHHSASLTLRLLVGLLVCKNVVLHLNVN